MIYEEKTLSWKWALLLLAAAFAFLYPLWQLGDRELYWGEGCFAAMAMEIRYFLPLGQAHHELIPYSFPLYPWLAALLTRELGLSMEFSLRFLSVVSLFLLTVLVWEVARRSSGTVAATVAAAMLISSNIVLEKAIDGYPNMTGLLFLFAGWIFWFREGAEKSNWNLAWAVSMLFCGLAFLNVGWEGLVVFAVPLVFMRRPLTLWPKLRKPGFYAGLGILALFVLAWLIPIFLARDLGFRNLPLKSFRFDEYWEHLLYFPFDVLVRFFPWSLFAWAPFCVALHPLDKNPIFSRFLRTITVGVFMLLWLSPFAEPRDIVLLAPSLSVLTGSYYWIVARRYGHYFQLILPYLPIFALCGGLALVVFYLTPTELWRGVVTLSRGSEFHDETRYLCLGLLNGLGVVVMGLALLTIPRERIPLWAALLGAVVAVMMCFWGLTHPYRSQENSKREIGRILREAIERSGDTADCVYKDKDIAGLYGECFYMGLKVRKINSMSDLPRAAEVVFLLSIEPPLEPSRTWTNLLPEHNQYRREKLYLWKGVRTDKKHSVREGNGRGGA